MSNFAVRSQNLQNSQIQKPLISQQTPQLEKTQPSSTPQAKSPSRLAGSSPTAQPNALKGVIAFDTAHQELKSLIDQAKPTQIQSQNQKLSLANAKPQQLLAVSSNELQIAVQNLKKVSNHQVLNLTETNAPDSHYQSVSESSRSIRLKQDGSVFAPERLTASSTLELVGHGSVDGRLLGGKTAKQVATLLRDSGVKQLDTLHLKSCHSADFAQAVKNELTSLGIEVGQVKGYNSRIAIDKATGQTLIDSAAQPLSQVKGHSGTLDQLDDAFLSFVHGNPAPLQTLLNQQVVNKAWDTIRNVGIRAADAGLNDVAQQSVTQLMTHNQFDQAIAVTQRLGAQGQWGVVQTIGENAVDQNQPIFARMLSIALIQSNRLESMALVDKLAENGHGAELEPIINALTTSGQYKMAVEVYLTKTQVDAENTGRWDEDFAASFEAIQNKPIDKYGTTKLDLMAAAFKKNVPLNANSRHPVSNVDQISSILFDPYGPITATERNLILYCQGNLKQKPGSSSLGSLEINGESVKGRPAFSTTTQAFMPLKAGQHRRHIMAWHNIRDIGSKVLSKANNDQLKGLLNQAPANILSEVSKHLKVEDIRRSDNHDQLLTGVLFIMNSNPNNLWPGDGRTNSSIANAWSNVNKALNRVGNSLDGLKGLQASYAQAGKISNNPYRQAQALAAEVIQAGVNDNVSPEAIRVKVLECIAGLEIDTLGSSKDQTGNIFKHQQAFIDTARAAYRWMLEPGKEPAPSLDQLSIFMKYPPGYMLNGTKSEEYNKLQVDAPIPPPPGVSQASRSQFQEPGGQTACTAMSMQGIAYTFELGRTGQQALQAGLDQTLLNGAAVYQQMHQSAANMGYNMQYFHPTEIPAQAVTDAGLQRGLTQTVAHNGTDIRDRVANLLNPLDPNNQAQIGISLVLGGATVSVSRYNDRYFVYDSHGFQGVSQQAFVREFDNPAAAATLIHDMAQARLPAGRDASLTFFRPL